MAVGTFCMHFRCHAADRVDFSLKDETTPGIKQFLAFVASNHSEYTFGCIYSHQP